MKERSYFSVDTNYLPQVNMMNEVRIESLNSHFRRTPTEYILYIISDGTMLLNEGGIEYTLQKGDVILLDPSRCHFGHKINCGIQYYYIHFSWNNILEKRLMDEDYRKVQVEKRRESISNTNYHKEACEILVIPKYCHLESNDFQKIERLASDFKLSYHNSLEYRQSIAGCQLITIFVEISRMLTNKFVDTSSAIDQLSIQIISYLKNHFAEKISSDDIAKHCHSNFDYLNRKFKQNLGKTIFQYLNEYRIEVSKIMLDSGLYNTSQIADKCGFCNEFYFSKVFKKQVGTSPSIFKRIQ